jgi:MFS family permease
LSTVAIQTVGRGLTLPFTIIYLNEVRGIGLGLSGALMSIIAVVGLLVSGIGGSFTDRFGARVVLIAGTALMIVGNVVLAFAATPVTAAIAFVLIGINFGVSWPAFNALVASVVSGELRQQYFGVNFAQLNLGIGVGGIVGGLFVDVDRPGTFTAIFIGNAATMLVPLALLLGPLRHVHGKAAAPPDSDPSAPGTYLAILRQPAVAWLTGLSFVAAFVGYGQMEAGFPAFARQVSQVSTGTIGIAFAINTAVIVVLQFWVLGRIAGHRRTRILVVMTGVWATSWVLLGLTGLVPATVAAVAGVLLFHAVFAFGETMLQPTVPAMTNDLAPDHLRGRYNAINSAAFQGGTILGPAAAGILLQHGLDTVYIAMLVVGCATIAWMSLVLERRIPGAVNGLTDATGPAATVVSDHGGDVGPIGAAPQSDEAAGQR